MRVRGERVRAGGSSSGSASPRGEREEEGAIKEEAPVRTDEQPATPQLEQAKKKLGWGQALMARLKQKQEDVPKEDSTLGTSIEKAPQIQQSELETKDV